MWLADHRTSGPEVVLAVGVAPSRRWAEQWYGLVVAVAQSCSPHAVLPAVVLALDQYWTQVSSVSGHVMSGTCATPRLTVSSICWYIRSLPLGQWNRRPYTRRHLFCGCLRASLCGARAFATSVFDILPCADREP